LSELHKFLFDGLPVRGAIVRLTDAWTEILARYAAHRPESGPDAARPSGPAAAAQGVGAWAEPVIELVGEMTAAAVLMQANIKFNGALILQVFGDGPVKIAVAEVQPDMTLRATAKVVGEVNADARLPDLVNVANKGRCAITLDPKDRFPGQQPYQGVVPLHGDRREKLGRLSEVLEHYMLQSEQLDTTLVLAADGKVAAGLLIQRLPVEGAGNLSSEERGQANEQEIGVNEDYNRIAILAGSLTRIELLELDVDTLLRRLFWEEKVLRFEPQRPRFACTCSSERVSAMIRGLGRDEADSILAERGEIEVGCDFCGQQYRFDAVDTARIFTSPGDQPPVTSAVQ
jgi:molecular chaperone Hsp33